MEKSEKKALISFLSIYVGSTVLMLSILFYSYYQKEKEMLTNHCSIEMNSAANELKAKILNAHMEDKKFVPYKLKQESLRYGLFSREGETIYSELETRIKNIKKIPAHDGNNAFYSTTIDLLDKNLDIKYIVIETEQIIDEINQLQVYMISLLIFSTIFIALIGFLLSKILLKPLKEKVNHMDRFIKDSAHELNTPIAVLMTSTSTLKSGRNIDKMLKYITSSAKQISQIYNDIHFSAFDKDSEKIDEIINLDEIVADSIDFFEDIADTKNISIEKNLEKCRVKIDKTKLQKLVNNLLSNAIKYSNKNSKVVVNLNSCIFEVEDFGIGISKEEQKEIFKRYKRGENFEGGFGIGLDIVNEICKAYDLKIVLNSEPSKGTKFQIDFSSIKN